jgi:SAM-dependent methyltransferase
MQPQNGPTPLRLNLGCGRNCLAGWINVDVAAQAGIDVVADLDNCAQKPLPFDVDSVDELLLSHVLEHLRDPLALMQELHRVAKPGARLIARTPYGSSDDAWEDPTHVRPYFLNSFGFFGQPFYWRADYGYRGDWNVELVTLFLDRQANQGLATPQLVEKIHGQRNVVQEMVAELVAVKPIRPARQDLITPPRVQLSLV